MTKDTKGNHLKPVKDLNKHMEDLIVEGFSNSGTEMRECALAGDSIRINACIRSIGSAHTFIFDELKKKAHIVIPVDVSEKIQQKQTHRVIGRRPKDRITISHNRAYKRKVNQRTHHSGITALDAPIGIDPNKTFLKTIIGKKGLFRKRLIIRQRDFKVDFIQIFDNITYGKFFEKLYHIVWSGQDVRLLSRLFSQFFSKVLPQRIKKNILDAAMVKMRVSPLRGANSLTNQGSISRFVAGALEAVLFNKRLKHV